MRAVLGIDAAWTSTNPSGVALMAEYPDGWRLISVSPSYKHFQGMAENRPLTNERPSGSIPDAVVLLASAAALGGGNVDLVAIDMPLALTPIVGRRASDNAVSREYGARKCGTHTPSALRPGRVSDDLREAFDQAGYPLLTTAIAPPGVIEVYPHPALVELADAPSRLPYKASRIRKYWPSASNSERRTRLYQQWYEIVTLLDGEIAGIAAAMPALEANASSLEVKAYEDMLDAIVCAWIAVRALEGRVLPFGDENSAIWIPSSRCATAAHR